MTIKEAAKFRLQELKEKPLKEKLRHLLTYYRIPIAAVLVCLAVGGSILHSVLTDQKMALQVYCLNAVHPEKEERTAARFLEAAGLDDGRYAASILCAGYDFSGNQVILAQMQSFIALLSAGEVDVVVGDAASLAHLAANDAFLWMDAIVPESCIENLVYMDYAEVAAADGDYSSITLGSSERMQEPAAVALRIPAGSDFLKEYRFETEEVLLAIPVRTQRLDSAKLFLADCMP